MPRQSNVHYVVRPDEPIERALRRFKRMCERAGIQKTVKSKRFYEKPSDARRREVRKSIRNRRRADRKAQERQQRKLDRARRRQRVRTIHAAALAAPEATPGTEASPQAAASQQATRPQQTAGSQASI